MDGDDSILLHRLRDARGFDAREVADSKCARLTRFFRDNELDAAVVGVSGGVDSALVLALLRVLERQGVLRRVVALLLPVEGRGSTGQRDATALGRLVAEALGAEAWEAPLTEAHGSLVASLGRGSGLAFDAWAEGQALSIARTPALYGAAALLQSHGYRSLVVGTTNRDEGAFLGFFGKASDAMVDLQPISDLHKSEVRALARQLGVPNAVVERVPRGDVHDGRTDEQMLGATYDAVELFLRLHEHGLSSLASEAVRSALVRQHTVNAHKYRVGSPAVHLDVMPRGVPGGWTSELLAPRTERRPPRDAWPGDWEPPALVLEPTSTFPRAQRLAVPGYAILADDVLTPSDCEKLLSTFGAAATERVGDAGTPGSPGVGSARATAWTPELARQLWQKLSPVVPGVRFLGPSDPTDAFALGSRPAHRSFRAAGLSPVLRFMRYDAGGRHLPHYDAGFDYGDGRRTLLSAVFFLTDERRGGALRFVRDGQEGVPAAARKYADWTRAAEASEVIAAVVPRRGRVVLFDHRLCHDVEQYDGATPRVVVRGDVVYDAIPDGRS